MDKSIWMLIGFSVIGFGLVTVIFGFGNFGSFISSITNGGNAGGQVGCGMMGAGANAPSAGQAGNAALGCAGNQAGGTGAQNQQAGNTSGSQTGGTAGNAPNSQVGNTGGNAAGAVQDIYIRALPSGTYDKPEIRVKAGSPVRLHFTAEQGSGCGALLVMEEFSVNLISRNAAEQVAEFTPTKPGTYEYHCGMHMFVGRMIVE